MKSIFCLIASAIFFSTALPSYASSLTGRWQYIGFIHEDHFFTPLDPDLILIFQFNNDGLSNLTWTWKGSSQYCSRNALYAYNLQSLIQLVVWVDPQNSSACQQDPDMILGRQSHTKYLIKNNHLYLELYLDNKPIYYVLEKIPT